MQQLTLAFALLASIGLAQAASHEHDIHHDTAAHKMQADRHQGTGMVKAVKSSKVQITHEPIASLQWPAMTMWFDLNDPASYSIKVGDQVHFEMMQNEKKKWVIMNIQNR